MTYGTDRVRYVIPALGTVYAALEDWALSSLAVLVRGGGPPSLDRRLGREI